MSRSAKDLRDIINVSRLSIRDYSTDEGSDDGDLKISDDKEIAAYISSRPSSAMSGTSSFLIFSSSTINRPNSSSGSHKKSSKSHTSTNYNDTADEIPRPDHSMKQFPSKFNPVPPIKQRHDDFREECFEHLFQYLDATIVSNWLEECNNTLEKINTLMADDFVEFSHFFLTSLSFEQYIELLDLEYSIIIDHLLYAFHAGISTGELTIDMLNVLACVVLKEYPRALKSKGSKLLLDIIVTLCSEKDESYRKLLKNIKYPSSNKQVIQWLLAIRAFGLINFVSGILRFYENVQVLQQVRCSLNDNDISKLQPNLKKWCLQAVCKNYQDVIEYLHSYQNVKLQNICDGKGRNLIFVAARESHLQMIQLLKKLENQIDVDQQSLDGNTALYVAVSKNAIDTVKVLLDHGADPNLWNEQANGATALHTAVMMDDVNMVRLLLQYGADRTVCMGIPATVTPLSLARELGCKDIAKLLECKD